MHNIMHHDANYDYYEIVCSIKGDGHQSAPVQSLSSCSNTHARFGGGAPYHATVSVCLRSTKRIFQVLERNREICEFQPTVISFGDKLSTSKGHKTLPVGVNRYHNGVRCCFECPPSCYSVFSSA